MGKYPLTEETLWAREVWTSWFCLHGLETRAALGSAGGVLARTGTGEGAVIVPNRAGLWAIGGTARRLGTGGNLISPGGKLMHNCASTSLPERHAGARQFPLASVCG
jgi:hypothetical protein